jgi:hypothetical protein
MHEAFKKNKLNKLPIRTNENIRPICTVQGWRLLKKSSALLLHHCQLPEFLDHMEKRNRGFLLGQIDQLT